MPKSMPIFLEGARASLPILLGVAPFGLIWGAVCVGSGIPEWGATAFTLAVLAGASQLAAVQLMVKHASLAVVVLTGLVINLRMFMYSASLAPHFKGLGTAKKGLAAYLLTDQAYALSIARYGREDGERINKLAYYLGAALAVGLCFNATTVLGAFVGALIPPEWDLEFTIPLTFIALVIPAVKDRPAAAAAATAGATALLANGLPYNLGLMAGAFAGILTGYLAERRQNRG
jgi:predicted branched-subunit amino acid permease